MTRAIALLMALTSTLWSQSAMSRIAVVRISEIYSGLESTAKLEERVRGEREEILKDPRAAELRRIINEVRELEAMARDKSAATDEQTAQRMVRSLDIKRQEAQTLQREFESFRSQREKEINRAMIAEIRGTLDRITNAARNAARQHGCELLLDSSGNTNSGVPFVVYQKKPLDLTDAVVAALAAENAGSTNE
jgi:Skp family chaperone for outer membrane proteins